MNENETNESNPPVETPAEEVPATTETLDDIASGFNVEEQVSQFQAQPKQPTPVQSETPGIPDPISNPEGYDLYMQQQAIQTRTINDTLSTLVEKVQGYEQSVNQQKVDADVEKAVSVINEKLKVDPKMAEIAMEMEYRANPAFKKIWDNRNQNPEAFNKALGVIGDKWAGKFVNQADPQLAENVRAAKTSQQTMGSAPKEDPDSKWSGLSDGEFAVQWAKERSG